MRKPAYCLLCALLSFGGTFDFGYILCYVNTAEAQFHLFLNESASDRGNFLLQNTYDWSWSAILNAYFLGYIVGVLILPQITDKFGRIRAMQLGSLISVLGSTLSLVAIPFMVPELLGLGRLIVGVGSGLTMNALLIFIQETSPTSIRGLASSLFEVFVCFNGLFGTVLGLPEMLGTHLSFLIGFGAIPNLLTVFLLLFLPETPKFLFLSQRKASEARSAISFYQQDADVEDVIEAICQEREIDRKAIKRLIVFLKTSYLRKALSISIVALVAQQTTGIVAIFYFTTFFFTNVGLGAKEAQVGSVCLLLVNTFVTVIASFVVEKVGRRPLLLVTEIGVVVSLTLYMIFALLYDHFQALWLGYGCLCLMFVYTVFFSLGPGPVPWFIAAELVPQHARSYVMSLGQIVNNIVILVLSLLFLPLYNAIGAYAFLILYIVPSILCIIYLYFNLPETKNREIAEIVLQMQQFGTLVR